MPLGTNAHHLWADWFSRRGGTCRTHATYINQSLFTWGKREKLSSTAAPWVKIAKAKLQATGCAGGCPCSNLHKPELRKAGDLRGPIVPSPPWWRFSPRSFRSSLRFRGRASLEIELIALRHQVTVLRRQRPGRPKLSSLDRLLWVWLYRIWPQVIDAMVLVNSRGPPRSAAQAAAEALTASLPRQIKNSTRNMRPKSVSKHNSQRMRPR